MGVGAALALIGVLIIALRKQPGHRRCCSLIRNRSQ
jgi:hypothetical protein